MKLVLYDRQRSGNCYRARLMLALLGLEYERVPVNSAGVASVVHGADASDPSAETRSDWFLRMNPRGQVPVLVADGEPIWDSIAIIGFLARQFDPSGAWSPPAPLAAARVTQWLILSQNELLYGLAQCRGMRQLGRAGDLALAERLGHGALRVLQQRLDGRTWLEGDAPTIADVACFPYISIGHEFGFELLPAYPAVSRWVEALKGLPGYVPQSA
ncbi:MAG TPA: glutathione S-transferase family protein [Ramlibacter sp.]|nr:glutathione S-transferase family protein [Ramlibacter sp.]